MSVGLHSGQYGMFVVGGSHREMLIGGPAASTVVMLEAAASAGQILISRGNGSRLAAWLCRAVCRARHAARPGAYGHDWVAPAGLPAPPGEVIASFLPATIRAHLLSGSAVPEHRTATIAFLQFGGLDEVIVRRRCRGRRGRMDELVRLVQEAVERYEVVLPGLRHRGRWRQDPAERGRARASSVRTRNACCSRVRHIVEARTAAAAASRGASRSGFHGPGRAGSTAGGTR